MNQDLINLNNFIAELMKDKFYGSIEIKFEAGKVVMIRKEQSLKIASIMGVIIGGE